MLTKEQQINILEEHHKACVVFWKREKHLDLFANTMALLDLVRCSHNPFTPKGERFDADVRRHVVDSRLQEFCELIKAELETSIKN